MSSREAYPKDCVLKYPDGWFITFNSMSGSIIKSNGPYKTKAEAEPDRRILNHKNQRKPNSQLPATLIAVFTRYERDFRELDFTPRSNFIRIKNRSDVDGRKFSGVILQPGWYNCSPESIEAYESLEKRQPELFK